MTDRGLSSFLRTRGMLSAEYAARRNLPGRSPTAVTLLREGIVPVPGFLTLAEVERMIDSLPAKDRCVSSPEGTHTSTFYDAAEIPGLAPFFESQWIASVMQEALGRRRAHCLRTAVQYRDFLGETGAFEQFFHTDTWLPRFKAFLYLTDVDEGGGPLRYLPRSNHGLWRIAVEHEVYRLYPSLATYVDDPDAAFAGCYWPHQVRDIASRLATQPVTLTGRRGTLVLFDARGLHATTPLQSPRTILYSYWTKRGLHTRRRT